MAHSDPATNRLTLDTTNLRDSQPNLIDDPPSLPYLNLGSPREFEKMPKRGEMEKRRSKSIQGPCTDVVVSPIDPNPPGPKFGPFDLPIPSPIITKRTRTKSTYERAMENPVEHGKIKYFCRTKGHGFIQSESGKDIFVHISDIEGEFVPREGDEVTFRLCTIPPRTEKSQAVHVRITEFTPEVHLRWDTPLEDSERREYVAKSPSFDYFD